MSKNASTVESVNVVPATTSVEPAADVVYNAIAKNVRAYSDKDGQIQYRVDIDVMIPAVIKDKKSDEYVEDEADYINFVPRVLIAQCIDLIEGLDLLYSKKKEEALRKGTGGFGAAELSVILRNAKLEFSRHRYIPGEEYEKSDGTTATHDYVGYNTAITKIVVSERIQKKLDELIDKMFDI